MREFELLKRVYAANRTLSGGVTIPPGDDMGAVRVVGGEILVTVDQVADGLHFDLKTTSIERVARKAITRNVSDVAAMAARPIGSVCAAALPRAMGEDQAGRLFDAMRKTAEAYGCPLFGGDISVWDHPMLLSVTVLAQAWAGVSPVLRSGAKVGDVVCVTGALGGSMEEIRRPDGTAYVHHLDFEPRVGVARILAERFGVHAMIDISDGLGRDLGHICRASGVTARILASRLPISAGAKLAAAREGGETWIRAIRDGEDYELCFTLSAAEAANLPAEVEGVAVTRIGSIVEGEGKVELEMAERAIDVGDVGWEHRGA